MSDFTVISAVSQTLHDLLRANISDLTLDISLRSPKDMQQAGQATGVSVWLYKVSRMLRHNARVASIIPVTSIRQSIHLSPLPGRTIPRDWNSNTILNNCNTFLVNSFTDSHTYLLFHGPK